MAPASGLGDISHVIQLAVFLRAILLAVNSPRAPVL